MFKVKAGIRFDLKFLKKKNSVNFVTIEQKNLEKTAKINF